MKLQQYDQGPRLDTSRDIVSNEQVTGAKWYCDKSTDTDNEARKTGEGENSDLRVSGNLAEKKWMTQWL